MIDLCADAAQQLGQPRSLGLIFGAIFASPEPLAFADLVERLGLSSGSVSQGLRDLRSLGAIRPVDDTAGPRERFVAEASLRQVIGGILAVRVQEPLKSGAARLRAIERRLDAEAAGPETEFLRQRLASLQTWHRKARRVLPVLQALLGPPARRRR